MKRIVSLMLVLTLALSLMACSAQPKDDLWKDATYTKATAFGEGKTTFTVEVAAGDTSVTFTVHTDEETVGAALMKEKLIDGEQGQYGLDLRVVNGMTADYSVNKSYWAFYINGEYAMTGVDSTPVSEGANYRFVYTKE